MKKWYPVVAIMLLVAIFVSGCAAKAQSGNTIKVHYTGTMNDGTEFDSSVGGEPLEFTIGADEVIEGFENAVIGMKVGETKTVTIRAEQAYPYNKDLVFEIDRSILPDEVVVGQKLNMMQANSSVITVTVIALDETTATIDANPEVAGEDLTFEIKLVEIVAAE